MHLCCLIINIIDVPKLLHLRASFIHQNDSKEEKLKPHAAELQVLLSEINGQKQNKFSRDCSGIKGPGKGEAVPTEGVKRELFDV